MSDTTASSQPAFAAFIGIDWGDKEACLGSAGGGFQQGRAGRAGAHAGSHPGVGSPVAAALPQRLPGHRPGAIARTARFALSKYEHLVLFPIHPTSAADYRKVFRPSGAKSDGPDAALHLDMLVRHRDKLRPLNPDTPETRALQLLTEDRRQLVNERTRFSNRLRADLKSYYPQLLQWFEDTYTPVALDFLERWPTLEELQKAKTATLRKFFQEHRCTHETKNQTRLEAMRTAEAATTDFAVVTAGRAAACAAVRTLATLNESIREYDRQIEQ